MELLARQIMLVKEMFSDVKVFLSNNFLFLTLNSNADVQKKIIQNLKILKI